MSAEGDKINTPTSVEVVAECGDTTEHAATADGQIIKTYRVLLAHALTLNASNADGYLWREEDENKSPLNFQNLPEVEQNALYDELVTSIRGHMLSKRYYNCNRDSQLGRAVLMLMLAKRCPPDIQSLFIDAYLKDSKDVVGALNKLVDGNFLTRDEAVTIHIEREMALLREEEKRTSERMRLLHAKVRLAWAKKDDSKSPVAPGCLTSEQREWGRLQSEGVSLEDLRKL